MRMQFCIPLLLILAVRGSAQEASSITLTAGATESTGVLPASTYTDCDRCGQGGLLASNHNFPNFIGFVSNPLQNIDPRSLTQIMPIFGSAWVSNGPALPDSDLQVFGPAITLALTDRLAIGLNQGGYAFAHFDRNDPRGPLLDPLSRTRGEEFGGTREGFLNLGGFVQYTLIADVENQFLLTTGLRAVAPCGSHEIFQGIGPALLAPYVTVGKELGDYHVLATAGYQFPARSGDRGTDLFYLNAHLDRQFGCVYPLVEVNWTNHTTSVDIDLPTRHGFIDFGNFESTGNVVTVAVGANLVLVRDRLELGAVYVRSVSTERDVDINALIVKAVLRF